MSEDSDIEEKINILILGNTAVGKTSYILKYTEDEFQEMYLATVGIDFKVKVVKINNVSYRVYFYDTTGQEKYKSISLNMIKNANGIILMYDITKRKSFDSINEWIESVKNVKGSNFPMILLGNKIDEEGDRKISKEEGEKLAKNFDIDFFEISNRDGININEAGLAMINKIIEYRQKYNADYISSNSSKISADQFSNQGKSFKCC
jgi:small GTP-binding protein